MPVVNGFPTRWLAAIVLLLCIGAAAVSACSQTIQVDVIECPSRLTVGNKGVVGLFIEGGQETTLVSFRVEPADQSVLALMTRCFDIWMSSAFDKESRKG